MSFTYGIGLHHVVPPQAPCWNCNAVEDLACAIQTQLDAESFLARELFPAGAETMTGSDARPFACVWRDVDIGGLDPRPPAGLLELAPSILQAWGSAPSLFELPASTADILVPNYGDPTGSSPQLTMLECAVDLDGAERVFGRNMQIGSLPATLAACAARAAEASPSAQADWAPLLEALRTAARYDLFFTFRF